MAELVDLQEIGIEDYVVLRDDMDFFVLGLLDGRILGVPILDQWMLLNLLRHIFHKSTIEKVMVSVPTVSLYYEAGEQIKMTTVDTRDWGVSLGLQVVGRFGFSSLTGKWYEQRIGEGHEMV